MITDRGLARVAELRLREVDYVLPSPLGALLAGEKALELFYLS